MARFVVEAPEAGLRLDAFLVRRGQAASAAAARRLLAGGEVSVGGRPARKGLRLEAGMTVDVRRAAAPPGPPAPAPEVPLEILYEDEWIVAVAKPAGLPSHPLRPDEGPTLAGALVARFPACATASPDPREGGLGHRLDVDTSGVIVAARDRATWLRLRAALGAEDCEKIYVAEVHGDPAGRAAAGPGGAGEAAGSAIAAWVEGDEVVVDAPIGRRGRRGGRVEVGAGRGLLPARTIVRVVERRGATTLVEAGLGRGRPHQVRAHLAALGCPLWGDAVYGRGEPGGLRLHALSVTLRHPRTGAPLRIEAPPPAWARGGAGRSLLR
jgi:23S rRNA pseudouridine1911/1915/1917 synthase